LKRGVRFVSPSQDEKDGIEIISNYFLIQDTVAIGERITAGLGVRHLSNAEMLLIIPFQLKIINY